MCSNNLISSVQSFKNHVGNMDFEILRLLMDENINYQDLPRDRFFELLKATFNTFKNHGDTELIPHKGCCGECKKGCVGISFVGNNSHNYLDIIFETEDNEISELSECSQFIMYDKSVKKNNRVYIDDGSDFQNFLKEQLKK